MEIKQEYSFYDLMENCWSGAIPTLRDIEEKGLQDELMAHLEEVFFDETPELVSVNDYLWFEEDFIKQAIGYKDEEDEEEEEEDEEEDLDEEDEQE